MNKVSVFFLGFCCLLTSIQLHAEVVLHPIHGKPIPFSKLQGQWVLINYWANWCEPCLHEIPELNHFYEQHKDQNNVTLFAVNYDMLPMEMQQQLVEKNHIHYPGLKQDPAEQLQLGGIRGIPVTFVFNPQGALTQTLYGEQSAKQLNKIIHP